jgi:hypothetical protein
MQTECIDLSTKSRDNVPETFAKSVLSRDTSSAIDSDGLPRLGQVAMCSFYIKSYFLMQEQLLDSYNTCIFMDRLYIQTSSTIVSIIASQA